VFIITVTPRNTYLFQVYSLIVDPEEGIYYSLSEETKLLLPGVRAPLRTGNIRMWSTSTKHTRLQPVLHLGDHFPNSAK
jgi:hypothetical protein